MKLNEHDFFSILYFTFFALFFSDLVYSDRVQLFLNWFRCLLVPLKRPPPPPTSDRSEVEGCRIGTAVAWSTWTTFGKATVFE